MGTGNSVWRERGIVRGLKEVEDLLMNGCDAFIWWWHFTF